jgi:hypothetical protein
MLRNLCDEARRLRESILRRVAAIRPLDEDTLPLAEVLVEDRIAELLFGPTTLTRGSPSSCTAARTRS